MSRRKLRARLRLNRLELPPAAEANALVQRRAHPSHASQRLLACAYAALKSSVCILRAKLPQGCKIGPATSPPVRVTNAFSTKSAQMAAACLESRRWRWVPSPIPGPARHGLHAPKTQTADLESCKMTAAMLTRPPFRQQSSNTGPVHMGCRQETRTDNDKGTVPIMRAHKIVAQVQVPDGQARLWHAHAQSHILPAVTTLEGFKTPQGPCNKK